MLAISIGLLLYGAAVWDGNASAGARLAAGIAAFAASAAWWLETAPTPRALAARVDRRLSLSGGLATALECARATRPPLLAELLAASLTGRATTRGLVRSSVPSLVPLGALCMASVALVALAREEVRPMSDPDWLARLSTEIADELARVETLVQSEEGARALAPETLGRVGETRARARSLAAALDEPGAAPAAARLAIAELGRTLDDLRTRLEPGSEAARALSRAIGTVDAARLAGASPSSADSSPPGAAAPGAGEPGAAGGSGAIRGSGEGADGERALELGTEHGTMAESPPVETNAPNRSPDERAGAPAAPPEGVALGRSWRSRHAAIVELWIERRRRAGLDGDPHTDSSSERE